MHGEQYLHVFVLAHDPADGRERALQRLTPGLAPMRGDQHQPFIGLGDLHLQQGERAVGGGQVTRLDGADRVEHGVPGDHDPQRRHAFGSQRIGGLAGRRQAQRGDPRDHLPVSLFGKRRFEVVCA